MRLSRLIGSARHVHVVAGWEVGLNPGEMVEVLGVDGTGPDELRFVCVGTRGVIRLDKETPPQVHGGMVWEAHLQYPQSGWGRATLVPERRPTATHLVMLDAAEVAGPRRGSALVWRPLLGAPKRHIPEFFEEVEREFPEDDLIIEGRQFRPRHGGFAEVAVASLNRWEALELVEVHESEIHPRKWRETPLTASIGEIAGVDHPAAALPPDHCERKGVLLMEAGRRLMWVSANRWPKWAARNLPVRIRDESPDALRA